MLTAVLRRQRAHLLTELRSLGDARAAASASPVVALLVTAAELHVRADSAWSTLPSRPSPGRASPSCAS